MLTSNRILDAAPTAVLSPATLAGRVLSTVVTLALLADATVQLFQPAQVHPAMAAIGFPAQLSTILGCLTLTCAVIYAVPRSAVLGAILVTGFLGGAIAMHFRVGDVGSPPQCISLVLGAMTWGGLYLRGRWSIV